MKKIEKYTKADNDKDILRIGLKGSDDKPILDEKGEVVYWEFDLNDIELPLKYSKCESEHRQNLQSIRMKLIVIEKKQDHKGEGFLTVNEEEKIRAIKEYYKQEEKTINLFLGENGVKKFLNGRNYYWDMFDDISEALKPILPLFDDGISKITNRIKDKYTKKEENVIE